MRHAVIDISGDMLVDAVRVLSDAGLRICASLRSSEETTNAVRIVFEDEFESILPEECGLPGWRLVSVQMSVQCYGGQRLTRVDKFDVIGRLVFGADGRARVERPAPAPVTERRAEVQVNG